MIIYWQLGIAILSLIAYFMLAAAVKNRKIRRTNFVNFLNVLIPLIGIIAVLSTAFTK